MQFDGQDSYYQDSNIVWIDNPEDHAVNDFLFSATNEDRLVEAELDDDRRGRWQ